MADKYLKLQYTVTLDFTAGTSPPTVTGDSGITFDYLYTELVYGTRYLYSRPHVTVGALVYKLFVSINNDFISGISSGIFPIAMWSSVGYAHNPVFNPADIKESLLAESSENTYNEYPHYNATYGSYNSDESFHFSGYTTPQESGQTVITWQVIYKFTDEETDMYNALLALYPNNVSVWDPTADPWLIDNDLPYRAEFPPMHEYTEELSWYIDDDLPYRLEFPTMYDYSEELPWYIDEDLPYRLEFPEMPEQPRRYINPAPLPSSFTFKDVNSADLGLHVETLPLCLKHEERTDFINFVSGSPLVRETTALRSKVITVTLGLKDTSPETIDKINSWLIGTGKLILSNDPDRYYIATCNGALTGERLLSLGKLPVQFNVMPYKYDDLESDDFENVTIAEELISKTALIEYEGNAPSESVYKITGTGTIEINNVQNGNTVEIHDVTSYCVIDIKAKKVYDHENNVILDHTYGNIFDLQLIPGNNYFFLSTNVTKVEVKKKTRWY